MRVPPPGPPAAAPDDVDVPDDDGASEASLATGRQRALARAAGAAGPAEPVAPQVEPDEPRDGDADDRDGREGEPSPRDRRRRRRAPPRAPAVPGARDELVTSAPALLPRAMTQLAEPPIAEPGDLSLTDPQAARRALVSAHLYAKHAMILAEAFRRATGATRAEGLAYLARLLVGVDDVTFARAALRELGPSTGILDLYPLELIEHVLDHHADFLPKVARGRFVRRDPPEVETFSFATDERVALRYRPELKVRGFAVVGGARPGYRFEPSEDGAYALEVHTPGRYTCLVSSLTRTGQVLIDRLELRVHAGARAATPRPIDEDIPPRDPDKVAAWPVPEVPSTPVDALAASEGRRKELESRFSAEELAQRIGVLGLANLRARLAARGEREAPRGPSPIVVETEGAEPEVAAEVTQGRARSPLAPEERSGHDDAARREGARRADAEDVRRAAEDRSRREGARSADAEPPSRASEAGGPAGGAPLADPVTELPIARPRRSARDRAQTVDADAAREILARQGALHDARREGPMVAAPRGLGRGGLEALDAGPFDEPAARGSPRPADVSPSDEPEGEEPTGDLDATEAVDRALLEAAEDHTRPIDLEPMTARATPAPRLEVATAGPTPDPDTARAPAPPDAEPRRRGQQAQVTEMVRHARSRPGASSRERGGGVFVGPASAPQEPRVSVRPPAASAAAPPPDVPRAPVLSAPLEERARPQDPTYAIVIPPLEALRLAAPAPERARGAAAEERSRGAVAEERSRGAVAEERSRGAVAEERSRGAVAEERSRGAVAEERSRGAVAEERSRGAVAEERSRGAVVPVPPEARAAPHEPTRAFLIPPLEERARLAATTGAAAPASPEPSRPATPRDPTRALDAHPHVGGAGARLREPDPTRPIILGAGAAPTPRVVEPDPTRPIILGPRPGEPDPTRRIDLTPMPPRSAVVVRTVGELDPTGPLPRDVVDRAIAAPPGGGRSPARAPRATGEAEAGAGGFADVRPRDRTQPIPTPRADSGVEGEDHTLAELLDDR